MRALVVTVCVCALLAMAARAARAHVMRANRMPMPRLALSLALDWKGALLRERQRAMTLQMRAPSPLRHQQMLAGVSLVPKAPTALAALAYNRLQLTLMRIVQPRRELTADEGSGYVRAVSAAPLFCHGVGALVTFETGGK